MNKIRIIAASIVLVLVVALTGVISMVKSQSGSSPDMFACFKAGKGTLVSSPDQCKKGETVYSWYSNSVTDTLLDGLNNSLQGNLDAETAAREAADADLQAQIDALEARLRALESKTATMEFGQDFFNLETGEIYRVEVWEFLPPAGYDFKFAYNSTFTPHTVVFQVAGVQIAFLDGTPFDNVNSTAGLTFTSAYIDQPFHNNDTIVLLTADGNYFKIGESVENPDFTVTFKYAQLP